jgi:predicted amidohydrolase
MCLGWVFLAAVSAQDAADWTPFAQRPALMPRLEKSPSEPLVLRIFATGHERTNGGWRRSFPVEGGRHYRFHARFEVSAVEAVRRCVLAQIDWRNAAGERVGYPDYPEIHREMPGETVLGGVYAAPEGAVAAVVDLILRWTANGSAAWSEVGFEPAAPPSSRPVTLAAVHHRPRQSAGPGQNRQEFGRFLDQAAAAGADLVLLPEGMTLVGTSSVYLDVAEPVPGPTTEFLGQYARRHRMYIVAGIVEQAGETAFNSAVLIGRDGNVLGTYRKVSLPREEIEGGLTPGDDYPVFDLDFGKVGILICWDIQFPEGARRLAARGAEVILLPIWGGIDELYPARAIENQIFLVSSSYDSRTAIWDRRGRRLAEAPAEGGLAVAQVDLAERVVWDWLGDLRARIPRESPVFREEGW